MATQNQCSLLTQLSKGTEMRCKKGCQKMIIRLVRFEQTFVEKSNEKILGNFQIRLWGPLSANITGFA